MESLKKEARKAYFKRKLPNFLSKIQEAGSISTELLTKIESWLGEFRKEDDDLIKKIEKYLPEGGIEASVPKMNDLFKPLSEEEKKKMNKWLGDVDEDMKECVKLAREQKDRISKGQHIDSKKLLDLGLFFITNEFSFNQVFAYRERLYKAKITEIIDNYNISRREAQDRAEITKEYFEYNLMKKNMETLKELEMYAKKYNQTF